MNIAFFDFDGTITYNDTFTQFIFYSTPKLRLMGIGLVLWPFILLYKIGLFPAFCLRPMISKIAFWGMGVDKLNEVAQQFVENSQAIRLRQVALQKLEYHKQQGDTIYVVSAGLDVYLKLWCAKHDIELLCTKLEVNGKRYTGRYENGDCSRYTKVSFIKNTVDLSLFNKIYAYGDTPEDFAMLSIATDPVYQWGSWRE